MTGYPKSVYTSSMYGFDLAGIESALYSYDMATLYRVGIGKSEIQWTHGHSKVKK
jgi:hypothetical protein